MRGLRGLAYLPLVLLGGCATVGNGIHGAGQALGEGANRLGELLSGVPPEQVQAAIVAATSFLPPPWNYIALGIGGAAVGALGMLAAKKKTPPPA